MKLPLSWVNGYGDSSRRLLSWDSINRLKEITLQAGATVANGDKKVAWDYNADSQRYKETVSTHNGSSWVLNSTVYFIWEGGSIIQKRIGGTTAYSCTNYFAEGEIRCLNNSLTRYYHTHDHLGSVYEITNTAGAVQAAYSFAAYGERTKRWGSENTEIAYTVHWNFKPAAFAKQAAADLSLTWYRAYDPKRGVWLTRDPVEERDGVNLYLLCRNNAIHNTDPLGLTAAVVQVPATAASGAAAGLTAQELQAIFGISAAAAQAAINAALRTERCRELGRLKRAAIDALGNTKGCKNTDCCDVLRVKRDLWMAVAETRWNYDKECHNGSDSGHISAQIRAYRAYMEWQSMLVAKCGEKWP